MRMAADLKRPSRNKTNSPTGNSFWFNAVKLDTLFRGPSEEFFVRIHSCRVGSLVSKFRIEMVGLGGLNVRYSVKGYKSPCLP